MISELDALNPTAEIRKTEYYNHSFVPDLLLSRQDGARETRPLFLCYSLRSAMAGHDYAALGPLGPVLLALREDDAETVDEARADIESVPELLATGVNALDGLAALRRRQGPSPCWSLSARGWCGARGVCLTPLARLDLQPAQVLSRTLVQESVWVDWRS